MKILILKDIDVKKDNIDCFIGEEVTEYPKMFGLSSLPEGEFVLSYLRERDKTGDIHCIHLYKTFRDGGGDVLYRWMFEANFWEYQLAGRPWTDFCLDEITDLFFGKTEEPIMLGDVTLIDQALFEKACSESA